MNAVVGEESAAEMLACALRILNRYPKLFVETREPFSVRLAVLVGIAAKLAKTDQGTTRQVWRALSKSHLEPKIRALEVKVVNRAFGNFETLL